MTLEDDSVLTLAQSGDAILDNVLSGNGTFRVSGTGTDKTNVVFNKEFGYDGAFDFSNTVFDLDEGHNRDASASADFNLSNSVLHLGESGGTFGNMVVNDGVQFDSAYLVIGSDTAALSGTGSLTFNSNTSIKLEGISVADDIALIDFDENTRYQDFITASGGITGSGNVTLQGQNLASFTGTYAQNGKNVANTTWVVSSDLRKNGSNSLQAGALLTGIELTGGELVISGAGTLAAHVTQADGAKDAAIRFSLADGTSSSSMTVSNTNDFTAAVSVDGGVKLSLAANNALGTTSGLTVADTAEVALNNGVSQTVGGLEGAGTVSLGSGSSFTLGQNGVASLETAVTGGANSTFTVNLGGSSNALTFDNQTAYNGRFVLQSAYLQFADNSSAEAVLGGSTFVLDDGAVFDLQSGTAGTLGGFVFDGGTVGTHQTTLADAGNAQLNVSGDVSLDESSKIEAGGITLTGASDVLRADNAEGVRQVFIQYTGEFNSVNGTQLSIDGDALASSDIFNEGDPDTVVAHGTWSGSVGVDEAGKQIYGNLQLTQIDLVGSGDGLILNAAGASDSTLSALVTGSGNLTLAGDLSISGGAANTYTGETAVTSGTVTLGMDSGFGNTSKLEIWSNAAVDLGAHSQTVGSLEIGNAQLDAEDAFRGTGTLTLAAGGTSEIWGTNNFSGTIVLGSGHDLALNNASGIGASAKVDFSAADSVLTIEGAESGVFGTELSGAGTVVISDSTIALSGGNTNFTGKWELKSDAGVTVSDNVDAVLGTGADVALDGTLTLGFASSSATDVTIDEKLSGSGSLVLTGANNQKFGLAGSGSDFNGTVTLNQIGMTVGGSGTGANNAEAFKDADLVLQSGSVLEVATGSTVTTFDKVSVNNGQTAGFKFGGLGFNSDGTTASGTSALVINELVNNGAAQIALDALGPNGDLLGAVAETSLVSGGVDVFQALIQTGEVMDESILNNFTLMGVGNGQATQEIKSATEQVATGYYDFDLALGDNGTDLGVSYDLTRIDISGGKTLTLSETGTLDAQLTSDGGAGDLTIAAGGDITLANASKSALNSYTGVTNVLGKLTAYAGNLGSTSELQIGASGHYINAGDNEVGLLDADGTLELRTGQTLEITQGATGRSDIAGTLTGGASTISSANNGVSGTVALSGKGTTLTIQNASGVGGDGTTISLSDDTSVIFAGAGFANAGTYAKINNELSGSGTVQIGDGVASTYLELLNKNNAFGKLLVTNGATVLVNDMHADNAVGDAAVNIESGGIARLSGSSGWTISNDLNLVEGGELVLAADDEAVNFAGTNQIISGGKVTLQSSVLYLGGDQGSSGATNAAVLDTAHLNVGSNGVLHVATGDDAQVLDKLTLGSSGHIWFDGTLGVSGTDTTQLGQLEVGSLGDMTGTIHLTASSAAGSGGEIKAAELLNVADSGSFQSLIEVTGTDTITDAELSGTKLDVSGNTSVVSDIKDGSGNTVAEGTFGFGDKLVAKDDKYAGVQYELQLINLLDTLEISESGGLDVRISGSGNLLVSNALTLTNKEGETNDYSGATTVSGTGSLVAGAGALGKTSALNVNESGSFTNSGDNTVGIFDLSGSAVLNEGTTLTVLGTTGETNDFTGTLTGSGSLALESGKTVVSQNNSGYAGNVVLGKKDGGLGAEIHFNAGASLGTGTITFADNLGVLSVEASGETTLTNKLDLSADGGEIVVSGDGDDTFAFHADQVASGFGAGSKLTLTSTNYSFTTTGNDVLDNVALSVTSGTLTVNGDAGLSDRSVYGLSLTDAVVDFGKLGNGDGVLDLEHRNLTIGGSAGSTTVRLDSEFQSVESDTGSAAFMQGGSLTLIRDASNDFSGDLSKLKLELDGAASAGTAIEQAVIQNNVETARLEGTAQGFGAVRGEDDGRWDLNLNLSFTTLRINEDRTFTVSEDGDIGLVITDNGADAAGGLSITGGASVQLLETNSYHGETSVSSGAELILAADDALGNTSSLNTETGTSVAFGDTNQTIGEIHASGTLVSDKGASGKLTITSGGKVSGANEDFHLDVALTGTDDLTLTNVASLGTDNLVTIANADAELVLAGAGGSFSNALSGAGSLRIGAGSDVALTGENDLTGGLAVDASGKVSAGDNIYDHIGTGTVALAGEADFTLESQDTADWTWNNTVTGTGDLTLARDGSGSRDLLFEAGSLSGFGGTLTLDNWTINLSETGGVKNATLGEIYGSDLTDLTLTNGAQALVTGEVGLETKNLTLGDGGRLTLNGVGAPGSTGTGSAHITVDELHLKDGFNIDLGIKDASVESSDLLLQDSGSGTTIDVATAMNGIDGNLANGTVTVNGESSTGQTIRFDVEQSGSGAESGTVAEAIYGYGIRTSGDTGGQQDLQITYSLEGIDIASGKTLVLTGDADDTAGNGSVLSVYLTGEGNLRVAGNTVRLSDDTKQASDFKGTTTVTSGATLYAEEGTLGETARLTTESRAHTYIEGDNTVRGITLASGGQLAIGSTDSMGGASDVTLTIVSSTDEDTSADQINHLYGELHGHGNLKVVGNGQVDEGVAADLTIHGSQTSFYGDLVLTSGAWVDIAATEPNLFGNSSAGNKVVVYKDSLLTIESERSGDASFYGVFTDGEDGSGGGTVEISLLNTSDHFRFAAAQSDADFTGTFVLNSGTIDFTDLFTSTDGSGDPLAKATLVLNDDGVVDLVGDGSGTSASNERKLGGLTMAGGTIEAGSIGYIAGKGAFNSTINLGSGTLTLEHATGAADDRQSPLSSARRTIPSRFPTAALKFSTPALSARTSLSSPASAISFLWTAIHPKP